MKYKMIKRIIDDKDAITCDELLTKLIRDESKFDKLISQEFKVQDYFKNVIKNNKNILLGYIIDNQIIGYTYLKYIVEDNNKGYLIDGLYIEEAYRCKGYAKELLEYALNLLDKENYDLKHDLITADMKIESLEAQLQEAKDKNIELQKEIVKLQTELKNKK